MAPSQDRERGGGDRITLVLGAGGARGLAHIGVIEVLEESGYEIAAVSGTSMGALIGGIYAMGRLETYRDWVCALEQTDVMRLLDLSFDQRGLFKGERIIRVLKEMIGDADIETLPLPFTAVATDLDSQREVWFNRGPLFDAIRASIAIPTIFTPHEYRGMSLVDGGLVNPVPVPPTFNDATDLVVAVSVNGRPARTPPLPPARRPALTGRLEEYRE
ncbi:MAG: serine protease, partial [Gammaproteobacteria bacterium]